MDEKIKHVNVADLVPDDLNFDKGTEYGGRLLEKSFEKFGAGRSILLDKNNRIIAGNKATEKYGALGGEDVIVVETDGTKLVAVKRTDIDLDSKEGRELALADNATQKADLDWAQDALREAAEGWDIPVDDWGVTLKPEGGEPVIGDNDFEYEQKYGVIVTCRDEHEQEAVYERLTGEGFECKVVSV